MPPRTLTPTEARRIAVRAQRLDAHRPGSVTEVIESLGSLQYDVTRAVAPSQDVVLWSRLGASYDPGDLQRLLDDQVLVEVAGMIRPAADLGLYTAEMAAYPGAAPWRRQLADWADANAQCVEDVLDALRSDGPLPVTELPNTCVVGWRSTGWTDGKNVQRLVGVMAARGQVAISRREGTMPYWDLAERVYPDVAPVPLEEALAERARRRLAALGLARSRATQTPTEPNDVGTAGIEVRIEGVRGRWRADPDQLARLDDPFEPRVALLSPLDRLVFDRTRMEQLFDFDYVLEMYKPREQRRWGFWALPVLAGDRLVGKVDATAEPREGELVVHAVHEDEPWSAELRAAVVAELESLASWRGLALAMP